MSRPHRRRLSGRLATATLLAASLIACVAGVAGTATAMPRARASLLQIENDVMCVACHESLAVAQSPEAFSERDYIRQLIAQGETRRQIEKNLVAQYGPSVLALPPANGFNLLVYVVPPAVLALGIVTLMLTVPRWRRRSRQAAAEPRAGLPDLDPADVHRLDDDLARRP